MKLFGDIVKYLNNTANFVNIVLVLNIKTQYLPRVKMFFCFELK